MRNRWLTGALRATLPLLLPFVLAIPAGAQETASRTTSMKSPGCSKPRFSAEDSASWTCPGLPGFVVAGTEQDVRWTISVGRTAAAARKEPAATTTFGPPNFADDTIEWRTPAGAKQPTAIIQRWTLIPSEEPRRSVLVVTRLPPGPVCHVAYVNATTPDADTVARKAADELARGFDCKGAPPVLGGGQEIPVIRP